MLYFTKTIKGIRGYCSKNSLKHIYSDLGPCFMCERHVWISEIGRRLGKRGVKLEVAYRDYPQNNLIRINNFINVPKVCVNNQILRHRFFDISSKSTGLWTTFYFILVGSTFCMPIQFDHKRFLKSVNRILFRIHKTDQVGAH